jgi:hypothetical protein
MNSYKIIFPYQSDRVHLAANEYDAFDRCYDEIKQSGRNPKIFVVLNLNSNTPYYLEMNNPNPDSIDPLDEVVVKTDVRDGVSEVLSVNPTEPIAPFEGEHDKMGQNSTADLFNNPMRQTEQARAPAPSTGEMIPSAGQIGYLQRRLDNSERQIENLGQRINVLENELIRTKIKVDYMAQLNIGQTNMNNLLNRPPTKEEEKEEEGCVIM